MKKNFIKVLILSLFLTVFIRLLSEIVKIQVWLMHIYICVFRYAIVWYGNMQYRKNHKQQHMPGLHSKPFVSQQSTYEYGWTVSGADQTPTDPYDTQRQDRLGQGNPARLRPFETGREVLVVQWTNFALVQTLFIGLRTCHTNMASEMFGRFASQRSGYIFECCQQRIGQYGPKCNDQSIWPTGQHEWFRRQHLHETSQKHHAIEWCETVRNWTISFRWVLTSGYCKLFVNCWVSLGPTDKAQTLWPVFLASREHTLVWAYFLTFFIFHCLKWKDLIRIFLTFFRSWKYFFSNHWIRLFLFFCFVFYLFVQQNTFFFDGLRVWELDNQYREDFFKKYAK